MQVKRLTSIEAFRLRVPAEGSAGDDAVELVEVTCPSPCAPMES